MVGGEMKSEKEERGDSVIYIIYIIYIKKRCIKSSSILTEGENMRAGNEGNDGGSSKQGLMMGETEGRVFSSFCCGGPNFVCGSY